MLTWGNNQDWGSHFDGHLNNKRHYYDDIRTEYYINVVLVINSNLAKNNTPNNILIESMGVSILTGL